MAVNYIWDTNICIYLMQNQFPLEVENRFFNIIKNNTNPKISVVTEIEISCWKSSNSNDLSIIKDFLNNSKIFNLDDLIKLKTIEIRREYGVKLPDAIIAATCIVNKCTLLSRNSKDFAKIEKLNFINPFEI